MHFEKMGGLGGKEVDQRTFYLFYFFIRHFSAGGGEKLGVRQILAVTGDWEDPAVRRCQCCNELAGSTVRACGRALNCKSIPAEIHLTQV